MLFDNPFYRSKCVKRRKLRNDKMTDVSKGASTTSAAEPGGSKVRFIIFRILEIGQDFDLFYTILLDQK